METWVPGVGDVISTTGGSTSTVWTLWLSVAPPPGVPPPPVEVCVASQTTVEAEADHVAEEELEVARIAGHDPAARGQSRELAVGGVSAHYEGDDDGSR